MQLSPHDIRYTQDSIGQRFMDGQFLSATFEELLYGRLSVRDIPSIEVVYKDGLWWALTGNRRLYLYRKLSDLGVVSTVPVVKRDISEWNVRRMLNDRMTTNCEGESTECRQIKGDQIMASMVTRWLKTQRNSGRTQPRTAQGQKSTTCQTQNGPGQKYIYNDNNENCYDRSVPVVHQTDQSLQPREIVTTTSNTTKANPKFREQPTNRSVSAVTVRNTNIPKTTRNEDRNQNIQTTVRPPSPTSSWSGRGTSIVRAPSYVPPQERNTVSVISQPSSTSTRTIQPQSRPGRGTEIIRESDAEPRKSSLFCCCFRR